MRRRISPRWRDPRSLLKQRQVRITTALGRRAAIPRTAIDGQPRVAAVVISHKDALHLIGVVIVFPDAITVRRSSNPRNKPLRVGRRVEHGGQAVDEVVKVAMQVLLDDSLGGVVAFSSTSSAWWDDEFHVSRQVWLLEAGKRVRDQVGHTGDLTSLCTLGGEGTQIGRGGVESALAAGVTTCHWGCVSFRRVKEAHLVGSSTTVARTHTLGRERDEGGEFTSGSARSSACSSGCSATGSALSTCDIISVSAIVDGEPIVRLIVCGDIFLGGVAFENALVVGQESRFFLLAFEADVEEAVVALLHGVVIAAAFILLVVSLDGQMVMERGCFDDDDNDEIDKVGKTYTWSEQSSQRAVWTVTVFQPGVSSQPGGGLKTFLVLRSGLLVDIVDGLEASLVKADDQNVCSKGTDQGRDDRVGMKKKSRGTEVAVDYLCLKKGEDARRGRVTRLTARA